MSLADAILRAENVLIEIKHKLSFIADAKFIEVWHKEGYWGVTVYPQCTK